MKRRILIGCVLITTTAVVHAGDLNVVGNLHVASNLTANVVTLQGVTDLSNPVLDFTQPGLFYRYTLTNHTTWALTNHVAGRQIWLQIAEDATGGRTNIWPAGLLWPGGHTIKGTTSRNHFNIFKVLDNGSHWLAQADGLSYSLPCVTNCSYALQFDGSQNEVDVPNSADFYPAGNFTFEFWIQTIAANSYPLGNYDNNDEGFSVNVGDDSGGGVTFFGFFFSGSGYAQAGSDTVINQDSDWHHLAVVRNGNALTCYVDGTAGTSATVTGAMTVGSTALYFGQVGNGTFGAATIDEARFSNVARYTSNFTRPYSFSIDTNTTIAYWKFDAGGGNAATDSTGQGHDGALQGDPLPAWVAGP